MNKKIVLLLSFTVHLLFILNVYAGGTQMNYEDFDDLSQEEIASLISKKIYFGHKSVGENILSGINTLKSVNSDLSELTVVQTSNAASLTSVGYLAHAAIGENFHPETKIDNFSQQLNNGLGGKVNIAFMKFCFVDIGTESDLDQLFSHYKSTLAELKQSYPETTFVHLTVPLFVEPSGIKTTLKSFIKSVIGKNNMYENTAKGRLNQMIRDEYSDKEPIFDLAYFESTYPDGSRLIHTNGSQQYESLIPEYSSDGGHLNAKGQEVLAKALLAFLAKLD